MMRPGRRSPLKTSADILETALGRISGFTLMEIMVAILILATSLVTILGLQESSVYRALRDNHKQQAMLYARRLLAAIESADVFPVEDGTIDGTPAEVLDQIAPEGTLTNNEPPLSDEYSVTLNVASWGIPEVNPEAMKKIDLTISWGESTADRLYMLYFIPNDEGYEEGEEVDEGEE